MGPREFILDKLVLDGGMLEEYCAVSYTVLDCCRSNRIIRSGLCEEKVDHFTMVCSSVHGTARWALPTLQNCKEAGEIYMTTFCYLIDQHFNIHFKAEF
jgi:hypothetical protein